MALLEHSLERPLVAWTALSVSLEVPPLVRTFFLKQYTAITTASRTTIITAITTYKAIITGKEKIEIQTNTLTLPSSWI